VTLDELITGLEQRGFENCSGIFGSGKTHKGEHYILFTDGLIVYSNLPHWTNARYSPTGLSESWPLDEFSFTELDFIMT